MENTNSEDDILFGKSRATLRKPAKQASQPPAPRRPLTQRFVAPQPTTPQGELESASGHLASEPLSPFAWGVSATGEVTVQVVDKEGYTSSPLTLGPAEQVLAELEPSFAPIPTANNWLHKLLESCGLRLRDTNKWRPLACNPVLHRQFGPGLAAATNGVDVIILSHLGASASWLLAHRTNIIGPATGSPTPPSKWNWITNQPIIDFDSGPSDEELKQPCIHCGLYVELVGETWLDRAGDLKCITGHTHLGRSDSSKQHRFDAARAAVGKEPKPLPGKTPTARKKSVRQSILNDL